jgi:prevent-host-death family protein
MIRMTASKARSDFAGTLDRVAYGGERIILRRHRKDMVAVIPVEDLERLQRLEDRADLRAAAEAKAEEGSIPWEQVKAELGL